MKRSVGTPVLVVNASYEPIAICTAKRALKMWAKGVARIEETYDQSTVHQNFSCNLQLFVVTLISRGVTF
jgi:hypothetical protein